MIGSTISHYKILERIGSGGMGVVYKAEDTKLKRIVALKFLPENLSFDKEVRERFIHEAQAISRLDHNNICNIHEIDETSDGRTFITMACYEGSTLKDYLRENGLGIEETLKIALQVATGLEQAHLKQIIHRDIKPANIFLTPDNTVKIVDFGLAKLSSQTKLTNTGLTPGTVSYMSPEQTMGKEFDFRTDIWSLGVVLYEMLAGKLPFEGEYEPAIIYAIINEEPLALSEIRKDVPPELEIIVNTCLSKDPEGRYASITELKNDLNKLMFRFLSQGDEDFNFPKIKPKVFQASRRKVFYAFVAAALLAFVFLFAYSDNLFLLDSFPREKKLVVLPFANIGQLPENQPFCDGLVEIITSKLTQLGEFKNTLCVFPAGDIRKYSVLSAEGSRLKFGANLVINGSIQKHFDHFTVTINLIDAETLKQLSSDIMDFKQGELSMIENHVLLSITDMLREELPTAHMEIIQAGMAISSSAKENYIKGRGLVIHYQSEENLKKAIEYFKLALDEKPDYAEAAAGLGEAYLRMYYLTNLVDDIQTAINYSVQALSINKDFVEVHITLGMIYNARGRYEKAVEEFNEALKDDSLNTSAYSEMAKSFSFMNNLAEAEKNYKKAIELNPLYWGGYNNLGVFYYRQARYSEAVEQFHSVVVLTPQNPRGYINQGASYFKLGDHSGAFEAFYKSLGADTTYPAVHGLGTIFFYEGKYDESARMYESALRINDQDYVVWGALASSYYWTPGKRERSYEIYRRAVQMAENKLAIRPNDPVVLSDMAGYLVPLGDSSRAAVLLDQVIKSNPSNKEVQFRLADVYEQLGNHEMSLLYLKNALEGGYSKERVINNPAFGNLKNDVRFKKLLD